MVSKHAFIVCLTAASVFVAPVNLSIAQGRPAAPPGQVAKPAVPPGQTAKPATPPGQAAKPATPPGRAGAPPTAGRGPMKPIVVNPKLAAVLQPLLPKDVTVASASAGFRNVGAFVSAVHASDNLGIPFASLKMSIVDNDSSLGGAIKALKPGVDPVVEAARAEKQAKETIAKTGGE